MKKDGTLKKVIGSDDKHTLWGYYRTLNIVCFVGGRWRGETLRWQRRWRDDEEGRWRNNLDVDFSSAECKDLCAAQTHRRSICPWLQTPSLMTSFTADVSLMLLLWWQWKCWFSFQRGSSSGEQLDNDCEVSGFPAYVWSWDKIKNISGCRRMRWCWWSPPSCSFIADVVTSSLLWARCSGRESVASWLLTTPPAVWRCLKLSGQEMVNSAAGFKKRVVHWPLRVYQLYTNWTQWLQGEEADFTADTRQTLSHWPAEGHVIITVSV